MHATHVRALVALLLLGLLGSAAWMRFAPASTGTASGRGADGKLRIVASFYPLAEFSQAVGGDLVTVVNVTPAGVEPHDYEPSPRQVADIREASLLAYNGGGLDGWADRLAPELTARGVTVLQMAGLMATHLAPADPEEDAPYDPHFWLDPQMAARQVEALRDALKAIDPANAARFEANADVYLAELRKLDADFAAGLSSCTLHEAVTSHAAFAYLGARYGFTQVPISGLSPEEEPAAGRLAEIAARARAANVKHIFFETLVSPQLARTIADEIGADTLVFNPLEGLTPEELAAGKTYFSVMRENLANLRIAMQCK